MQKKLLEQSVNYIFDSLNEVKKYPTKIGKLGLKITDFVSNGSFASLKENVKILENPDYAYFIRNTDLKTGEYPRYVSKESYNFLSNSSLFGNEILISNVADVGSVYLCPKLKKPMTLGNNMIMVSFENTDENFYLYMLLKSSYGQNLLDGITGGSAQLKFNKTDFKSLSIDLPSSSVISMFNSKVSPIFGRIEKIDNQKRCLQKLKSSLLFKYFGSD